VTPLRGRLPRETKCYVCLHVFSGEKPVLYVTRPEGDWCALCGDDHAEDASAYRVVGLGHVLDRDPTISEVLDLSANEEASRDSVGESWVRTRF
jgi:hypothetical protein